MSVFFDYSTLLHNSYQITQAQIATIVGSTTEADYDKAFSMDSWTVNPNSHPFFYSIIDPGHTGTTIVIEYTLLVSWVASEAGTLAYNWQIKASGGAWADILTGSVTFVSGTISAKHYGVYETGVLLPAEVRLIGTDADASWRIGTIGYGYSSSVRCIGTV